MIRKLNKRGVAALEFCIVAVPLFTLMLAIMDLGRYAITMQSLRALANAGARAWIICYGNDVIIKNQPLANCTGDPADWAAPATLSNSDKQKFEPFLYAGGLTPTLNIAQGASAITSTASQPEFTMLMPIWGTALNAPSASTSIPF
jgi:TadE-like protein